MFIMKKNGSDLNSYPTNVSSNVYMVVYGVHGYVENVDSGVYDSHKAYEIDKTKIKMFVPLLYGF